MHLRAMVERELTKFSLLSRYLLLLLVAHAITMEHIGEHILVPQALFTGVKWFSSMQRRTSSWHFFLNLSPCEHLGSSAELTKVARQTPVVKWSAFNSSPFGEQAFGSSAVLGTFFTTSTSPPTKRTSGQWHIIIRKKWRKRVKLDEEKSQEE